MGKRVKAIGIWAAIMLTFALTIPLLSYGLRLVTTPDYVSRPLIDEYGPRAIPWIRLRHNDFPAFIIHCPGQPPRRAVLLDDHRMDVPASEFLAAQYPSCRIERQPSWPWKRRG